MADGRFFVAPLRKDMVNGGAYRITGFASRIGAVGKYQVQLFVRQSRKIVRETWSDATGKYTFEWIAHLEKGYFLVAHDHGNDPLNAAIADLVTPEPMP